MADDVKDLKMRPFFLSRLSLPSEGRCPCEEREDPGGGTRRRRQTLEGCSHTPRTARRSQKLGDAAEILPQSLGRKPCPHLDFGLLASRAVGGHIPAVSSRPAGGHLFLRWLLKGILHRRARPPPLSKRAGWGRSGPTWLHAQLPSLSLSLPLGTSQGVGQARDLGLGSTG